MIKFIVIPEIQKSPLLQYALIFVYGQKNVLYCIDELYFLECGVIFMAFRSLEFKNIVKKSQTELRIGENQTTQTTT